MVTIVSAVLSMGHALAANYNPDVLWNIVTSCVDNEQQHGDPKPCALVNLHPDRAHGFAVLKDIKGATQYLLLPTQRITGIEDPQLLAPDATNYFGAAWKARSFVERAAGRHLPRTFIALAVNSQANRGQNQLHIHIDCVRADVAQAIATQANHIGRRWKPLGVPLGKAQHQYLAMRVYGANLGRINPFKLLANTLPGARANIGQHTLVVVGAKHHGRPGFVLLDYHIDHPGDWAAGEELLDHNRCTPPAPAANTAK
jgi:CDP-diacylglycerol pyrophosphatase